jgi:hypothetical protein
VGAQSPSTEGRPYALSREDVIAKLQAAINGTRLPEHSGHKELANLGAEWTVGDILPVTSLTGQNHYFLIYILDAQKREAATIAMSDEGHMMAFGGVIDRSEPIRKPMPRQVAVERVATKAGQSRGTSVRSTRYVFARGSLEHGSPRFVPLVQVRRTDGDFLVNSEGRVFRSTGANVAAREIDVHRDAVLETRQTGGQLERFVEVGATQ